MTKRMDEKTWKEATADAETTPWWVHELIAEARRARESEADGLLAANEALACLLDHARGQAQALRLLRAFIQKARGE